MNFLFPVLMSVLDYEGSAQKFYLSSIRGYMNQGKVMKSLSLAKDMLSDVPSQANFDLVNKLFVSRGFAKLSSSAMVQQSNTDRIEIRSDGRIYVNGVKITSTSPVRVKLKNGKFIYVSSKYIFSPDFRFTVYFFNGIMLKVPQNLVFNPVKIGGNYVETWISSYDPNVQKSLKFVLGGKATSAKLQAGQVVKVTITRDSLTGTIRIQNEILKVKLKEPLPFIILDKSGMIGEARIDPLIFSLGTLGTIIIINPASPTTPLLLSTVK